MSECPEQTQFETQVILLVISLCFHVFQAFVTGMKLRVKCRDCMCSVRPKNSSDTPSPSSSSSSSDPSPTERSPIRLGEITIEK